MDPEKTTKAPSTRSVSDDNGPVYNEVPVDPVFGQTKRGLSGEHPFPHTRLRSQSNNTQVVMFNSWL